MEKVAEATGPDPIGAHGEARHVVRDTTPQSDAGQERISARRHMREWIFRLLRGSGIPWALRELVQRKRITILCYHRPAPHIMQAHLAALSRRYRFIGLDDLLRASQTGELAGLPPKSLIVTLDDGHRSNFALRDVFARFGVRPTVFLCSDIAGTRRHFWWTKLGDREHLRRAKDLRDEERLRWLRAVGFDETTEYDEPQALSAEEIQEARATFDFQSHTRFHPILPSCTLDRARAEIAGSKSALEQRFGLNVYALAYPNGDYTRREAALAREAGYACAVGVGGGSNDAQTDPFELRRIAIPDGASVDELVVKTSCLWDWLVRRWPFRLFENRNARPVGFVDMRET